MTDRPTLNPEALPELVEALDKLLTQLHRLIAHGELPNDADLDRAIINGNAALAKAKGE